MLDNPNLKEDLNNVKIVDKQEVSSNSCLYMSYILSALCLAFG